MNAPPRRDEGPGQGPQAQSKLQTSAKDTPFAVTIKSKRGRVTWRRFASRAGALAELRLLHAKGIEHARVEGPR